MPLKLMLVLLVVSTLSVACSPPGARSTTIMQSAPGDPVGSANIGTGSVTTNAAVPDEAKAAGIGLAP